MDSILGDLVSIVLRFLPFFLVPFAFKFAGGALASIYGAVESRGKKGHQAFMGDARDPGSRRARARERFRGGVTRNRAEFARNNAAFAKGKLGPNASRRDRVSGAVRGRLGNAVGANGRIFAAESALNKAAQEQHDSISNYGDDTILNARSGVYGQMYDKKTGTPIWAKNEQGQYYDANKQAIDGTGFDPATGLGADGRQAVGKQDWQTLDGNKIEGGEAAVKAAKRSYPLIGSLQSSMGYRMKKTSTAFDQEIFKRNAAKLQAQNGMSDNEVQGVFTGVGFARQNERLEAKHSGYGPITEYEQKDYGADFDPRSDKNGFGYLAVQNPAMETKNRTFVDELHNAKGNWTVSQMRDTTIDHMGKVQSHLERQFANPDAAAAEINAFNTEKARQKATAAGRKYDPVNNADDRVEMVDRDKVRAHAQKELQKVYEMGDELNPKGGGIPQFRTDTAPGDDGQPQGSGYGGLSGAPVAVQNAAKRLKASQNASVRAAVMGTPAAPPAPPAPPSGPYIPPLPPPPFGPRR